MQQIRSKIYYMDFFCALCPKDPPVLKVLRRVNFGTGTKFTTAIAKRYGECSEVLVFSRRTRQENGTDNEKLRR